MFIKLVVWIITNNYDIRLCVSYSLIWEDTFAEIFQYIEINFIYSISVVILQNVDKYSNFYFSAYANYITIEIEVHNNLYIQVDKKTNKVYQKLFITVSIDTH